MLSNKRGIIINDVICHFECPTLLQLPIPMESNKLSNNEYPYKWLHPTINKTRHTTIHTQPIFTRLLSLNKITPPMIIIILFIADYVFRFRSIVALILDNVLVFTKCLSIFHYYTSNNRRAIPCSMNTMLRALSDKLN
ncbi:hypothetical protein D3C81_1403680 [compost metagenome]